MQAMRNAAPATVECVGSSSWMLSLPTRPFCAAAWSVGRLKPMAKNVSWLRGLVCPKFLSRVPLAGAFLITFHQRAFHWRCQGLN